MTTLIIIIACIFIATVIAGMVRDYKYREYIHYCNKAVKELGITPAEFELYYEFAKKWIGRRDTAKQAYLIAEEEQYDLNYK